MVIDTSAILAMLFDEPERKECALAIDTDPIRLISPVSVFEASMVAVARLGPDGIDELDLLLSRIGVEIQPLLPSDLPSVRRAFLRYGKGRHPAALNFGDCFSYALAIVRGEKLLFKGNDFAQTDVTSVI
ncbi:MAG: type II toxin-antitoxin system VapC family toxin [Candidatus Eremiobacteraeota bacterium]|nr:type II toxin-antitoxin system VapC family toxin [Candidatus Eremiobacteraeota bacterium]MCW5871066.1 type II toxin-antitoxin system VapC family toxin [Candidatus Eremiobacteraeota bacterium]